MIEDITTVVAGFCNGALLVYLILNWKWVRFSSRIALISFNALTFVSTFTRLFLYNAGVQPAPPWFSVTINVLLTMTCISLIASIWGRILKVNAK